MNEVKDEIISIIQSSLCGWGCENNLRESANGIAKEILEKILALEGTVNLCKDSEILTDDYGYQYRYQVKRQFRALPWQIQHIVDSDKIKMQLFKIFDVTAVRFSVYYHEQSTQDCKLRISVFPSQMHKVPSIIEWSFPDCYNENYREVFIVTDVIGDQFINSADESE